MTRDKKEKSWAGRGTRRKRVGQSGGQGGKAEQSRAMDKEVKSRAEQEGQAGIESRARNKQDMSWQRDKYERSGAIPSQP